MHRITSHKRSQTNAPRNRYLDETRRWFLCDHRHRFRIKQGVRICRRCRGLVQIIIHDTIVATVDLPSEECTTGRDTVVAIAELAEVSAVALS